MNSLLTLAKDLEQKSKAQQQSTGAMLKTVFSEHEQSVKAALNASGETISAAIAAHNRQLNDALANHSAGMTAAMQSHRQSVLRMVGRTWLTLMMVSGLLMAFSGSVLWWQGSRIVANLNAIERQNATLSKLNAKTWGIEYREGTNGRFLVLPAGTVGDPEWKVEKRNAVKLVKE